MHSTPFHRWLLLSAAAFVGSQLSAQTTTWTSFEDRAGHAIAADPQGGVMMFGGESLRNAGTLLNDTNRLNAANTAWSRETHATSPTARRGHAMVAAERQGQPVYIAFGGISQTGQVADTWVNLGGVWGPRGQGTVPTARSGHGMVTDFLRNEVYLIGGLSGALPRNDVYRYDPNTEAWSLRLANGPSGTVPPQRRNHSLAYDPGLDRVILFGGQGFAGTLNDTWAYDPTSNTWANLNPTNSPPPRGEGAMTYLLGFGVVLFGGKNPALPIGQQVLGDTWVFQSGNWMQPANLPTSPAARFGHAMSPDQSATNVVLLGGSDASGAPIPGTWLWNGSQWLQQLPAPSARNGAAMAYDSTRNRHVVFGGRAVANGADLDETWEIDGVNWRQQQQVTTRPSARSDAAMAFDKARSKVVLYGGRSQSTGTDLGDTWEWDGQTWTLRSLANNPPPVGGAQMVYDSSRNRILLVAGAETWKLDSAGWQILPIAAPAARAGACMAFDPSRNRLVIFGGTNSNDQRIGDTWEWGGTGWTAVTSAPGLTPRQSSAMVFDPTQNEVLIVGGVAGTSQTPTSETYGWNGVSWSSRTGPGARAYSGYVDMPGAGAVLAGGQDENLAFINTTVMLSGSTWATAPGTSASPFSPSRAVPALAYDVNRQRLVLFGGNEYLGGSSYQVLGDLWENGGSGWIATSQPGAVPSPRSRAAMAFDPIAGAVVLFGGNDHPTLLQNHTLQDTWSWNGTSWTQLQPTHRPQKRCSATAVTAGSQILLFGGQGEDGVSRFQDLWSWTGSDWNLVDMGKPSGRTNYGAAYDRSRDRLVMFGGMTVNNRATATYNNETLEWDGDSWMQRFPANAPSPRGWCKMTYDVARSRVVLFGGADANLNNTFQDTWEWDGTNWTQVTPAARPPGSLTHDLTFDTARNVAVAFGSFGTWDYGPISPASTATFPAIWPSPATCTGSLGPIRIQTLPWSGPWLGDRFEVDFVNRPANSLGLFLWGFSNTTWNGLPLPVPLSLLNVPSPCNLLVDPFVTELVLAPRYQSFLLPNDPILLSLPMFVQAGFFDNSMQGTQIVTTNGLELTFGRK